MLGIYRAQYKVSKLVGHFVIIGSIFYCFNGNLQKVWPTKVKFDWPLGKIGLKMASSQLLYCALIYIPR